MVGTGADGGGVVRRGKTETKAHEQAIDAERAARLEAARDPRTRFEVCIECGKARGITTGYLRIRDESFVCGECVGGES